MKIISIGECMAELSSRAYGNYHLNFAGDTANTSIYLSRLGVKTSYLTSVGNDKISKNLINFLKKEKILTNHIKINSKKSIGLYLIENNKKGEREFFYWRSNSAAKTFFENIKINKYFNLLKKYDAIYFSGITLSIYDYKSLNIFYKLIKRLKKNNIKIFFDLNIRLKNWKSTSIAKKNIKKFCSISDIIFISKEDLNELDFFDIESFVFKYSKSSYVLFREGSGNILTYENGKFFSKYKFKLLKNVKDTTGCGDAFNASFIFHYMNNNTEEICIKMAHKLGKSVALTKGAIINSKKFKTKNYDIKNFTNH